MAQVGNCAVARTRAHSAENGYLLDRRVALVREHETQLRMRRPTREVRCKRVPGRSRELREAHRFAPPLEHKGIDARNRPARASTFSRFA